MKKKTKSLTVLVITILFSLTMKAQTTLPTDPMGSVIQWATIVETVPLQGFKVYYGPDETTINQELDLPDPELYRQTSENPQELVYERSLLQEPFVIGQRYCFQVSAYTRDALNNTRESAKSDVVCGIVADVPGKVIRVRVTD